MVNKKIFTIMLCFMQMVILISCGQKSYVRATETDAIPTAFDKKVADPFLIGKEILLVSSFDDFPPYNQGLRESINYSRTNAFFDFDSGKAVNSKEADIYLSVLCAKECSAIFVALDNVAVFEKISENETEPDYAGCLSMLNEGAESQALFAGVKDYGYVCVRTSDENIAQILVTSKLLSGSDVKIKFDFKTWKIIDK